MNSSPTLRTLAGLPTSPPRLDDSTLVVIDAQQAYAAHGPLPLEGIDRAAERVAVLLAHARSLGVPIIHVAHLGEPGSPFDPNEGGRFLDEALPGPGEPVVEKRLPNSFADTGLLPALAATHADADAPEPIGRPLVIAGFMTHMCISSTARAALDLGFDTTVVSDATATRSLPSAVADDTVPAAVVHRSALAALSDRFSVVTTTAGLIGPTP